MDVYAKLNSNIIKDNTRVILNFLSFAGLPNNELSNSGTCITKLKKIFQYVFAIYLLYVFALSTIHRFKYYSMLGNNIAVDANVIVLSVSSLLLKVSLIMKMKRIKFIFKCFVKFMHRYQIVVNSVRKKVIICCSISFVVPFLFSVWHSSVEGHTDLHDFICFDCLLSNKASRYFFNIAIDVGYSVNTFTFPLITTILLSFIYIAFCKLILKPFAIQLKKSQKNPTSQNIKKNLIMLNEVRQIWHQIEDFASVNAFFLYGLDFTLALRLVGKYSFTDQEDLSVLSIMSGFFTVTQMIILCISGSKVVKHWKDVQQISQEISQIHSLIHDKVQVKDMLLLWSFVEVTKADLSFTCLGIFTLDWSLLFKTVATMVTFGVLMVV